MKKLRYQVDVWEHCFRCYAAEEADEWLSTKPVVLLESPAIEYLYLMSET